MNAPVHFLICTLSLFTLSHFLGCPSTVEPPAPDNRPDTTSHDFVWRIDRLGEYPSYLNDVFIIDENNIWAVGEIYVKDGTGEYVSYNAAQWNGQGWNLVQVLFYTFCGQPSTGSYAARAVWSFNARDIWIASANSQIAVMDGGTQREIMCLPVSVSKIWGNSRTDVYTVGPQGQIAHFNGTSWTKLESGTTVDLTDVWGSPDGGPIWVVGSKDLLGSYQSVLLRISGTAVETAYNDQLNWSTIRTDSLSGVLTSVWTDRPERLFVCSHAGVYQTSALTHGEGVRSWFDANFMPGFPHRLRGSAANDLLVVGDFTAITHYNGSNWRHFGELKSRISWKSVAVRGNLVVAVGADYDRGVGAVAFGMR